jgi:hypothetical protein
MKILRKSTKRNVEASATEPAVRVWSGARPNRAPAFYLQRPAGAWQAALQRRNSASGI